MADLLGAAVQASVRIGTQLVGRYAGANRTYVVRLWRPGADPTFDRTTGTWTNPPDTKLYEGPARIRPTAPGGVVDVGDEPVYFASAMISIDEYEGTQPRRNDLVEVVVDATSTGTRISGRWFKVEDVEVGGLLDYGPVLSCSGTAPSRRNQ